MKKTIKDYDLSGKKVIIRVDFNVPIKDGEITDDNRIKASLETINYAINNNAKVILMSHLGRIKTEEDKIKNTLEPVALRLRFEDLNNKAESSNSEELGKYWASLGDIYINDAFGTSHRSHASNVGIASNLPNGIGFLIEKEIKEIEQTIKNPQRPFTVILGGSKVKDKIGKSC